MLEPASKAFCALHALTSSECRPLSLLAGSAMLVVHGTWTEDGRMTRLGNVQLAIALAASLASTAPISAQTHDHKTVARNLVSAAMIKPGDKVLITGGLRDAALMEDIAVETMKAGGQPSIMLQSES